MPPKRKSDPKQHSLEEITEKPATRKRSKKGDLTNPEIEKKDDSADDLIKRKLARKHQGDPAFKEEKAEKKDGKKQTDKDDNSEEKAEPGSKGSIIINRAPVLTLWVAAVAEREGYSRESALTFGKAIAGIMAQAKGRRIGVFEAKEDGQPEAKQEKNKQDEEEGIERIKVFGMQIKAVKENGEFRSTAGSNEKKPIEPKSVQKYLENAFKERLRDAEEALKDLAESYTKDQIGNEAYSLYEQFRPDVAQGQQGWGRKGKLELERLKDLKSGA